MALAAAAAAGLSTAACLSRPALAVARGETPSASQAAPASEFTSMFDGKTLKGWRGDPTYWTVKDGAIVGGSPKEIPINTFLIHEGNFRNFELRFKYRFRVPGNSGIQFRSRLHPAGEFAVSGYQANVVTVPPSTAERFAMLYEERGRGILAANGERTRFVRKGDTVTKEVLETVNTRERLLAAAKPYPEWNEQVVIAYEHRFVNALNGLLAADTTDEDVQGRAMDGFIALQGHTGPPMEVQYKDLEIRVLTAMPDLGRFATVSTQQSSPAANATAAPAASVGRDLFTQRCAGCHATPGSDAPQQAMLAQLPPQQIVDALTQGIMQPQARGLTRAQIDAIAGYLTSRSGQ